MSSVKQNVLHYPAIFNPTDDGRYEVSFPDFPGCVTFGQNFEEAKAKGQEVLELWLEEMSARNEEIPRHYARPIIDDILVSVPSK